jgi:hypothetical protein
MNRRIGDRRRKPRFEIVGDLWGSIDGASLTVKNLGRRGALLESPLPLPADSVHWVSVPVDGQLQALELRVRHSTPADPSTPQPYLIGVEFTKVNAATTDFIERCIAADLRAAEGGGES